MGCLISFLDSTTQTAQQLAPPTRVDNPREWRQRLFDEQQFKNAEEIRQRQIKEQAARAQAASVLLEQQKQEQKLREQIYARQLQQQQQDRVNANLDLNWPTLATSAGRSSQSQLGSRQQQLEESQEAHKRHLLRQQEKLEQEKQLKILEENRLVNDRREAELLLPAKLKAIEANLILLLLQRCEPVIDLFIRTRNKFDSSEPSKYNCALSAIIDECEIEVQSIMDQLRGQLQAPITINISGSIQTWEFKQCVRFDESGIGLPDEDDDETYWWGKAVFWVLERSDAFYFDDERNTVSVCHLTPFRGTSTHRVFGEYKCSKCRRTWSSAYSFCDKWQRC
jgi:hypothetical protein